MTDEEIMDENENPNSEKWYAKTWVLVLLLIFLTPIGIAAMWIAKKWTQNTRIGVSVVLGLMFLIGMCSDDPLKTPPDVSSIGADFNKVESGTLNTPKKNDRDSDGVADEIDCHPGKPAIKTTKDTDTDCDGIVNEDDCDPEGHTDDLDCDGVTTANDCDDTDAENKKSKAGDSDCDGIANEKDCAPDDADNDSVTCVVPFAAAFDQFCEDFRNASNEIKQGQIVKKAKSVSKAASIKNARGELTSIDASREGDTLDITISVAGGDYKFTVESLFSPIRQGSSIYNTVSEMSEGDCVIFSASGFESTAIFQESEVCEGSLGGRIFFSKFSSVKPCPE